VALNVQAEALELEFVVEVEEEAKGVSWNDLLDEEVLDSKFDRLLQFLRHEIKNLLYILTGLIASFLGKLSPGPSAICAPPGPL